MKIQALDKAVESTQNEKEMQTVCEGCPFNRPQPNDNENLGDYCMAGRLEKFKENKCEIINVEYNKKKDVNSKIVKNRVCNMLRNESWEKMHRKKHPTDEELVKKARKEIEIPCTYILYCPMDEAIDKEPNEKKKRQKIKAKVKQFAETMKTMDEGKVKPNNIIILNAGIKPYEFITYLRRNCEELSIKSKWIMEYISKDYLEGLSKKQSDFLCISLAIKKVSSIYFSIFYAGDVVPDNYLYEIDKLINDDLKKVLMVYPESSSYSGCLIQRLVYKQYTGEALKSEDFIQQMKQEIESQKCQHMIYNLKDIVKNQ